MSEMSQGPGWWKASDDKWYPPETHPDVRAKQPPVAPPLAPPPAQPAPGVPAQTISTQARKPERPWYRKKRFAIPLALFGLIILIAALAPPPESDDQGRDATETSARPSGSNEESTSPAPTQDPDTGFATFGDGTHRVGSDVQPGTYRLRSDPEACYWARLAGFTGEISDLKANGIASAPTIVTILPEDAGFESRGCGKWTTNLAQLTSSQTTFGDGTWQVGVDVLPGTYRSSGGDTCYWSRLASFTGGIQDAIIANGIGEGPTVVTIAATDKGFEARDCGDWTAA